MNTIEQSDRTDRKVYAITETGSEELLRWLLAPVKAHMPHIQANLVWLEDVIQQNKNHQIPSE